MESANTLCGQTGHVWCGYALLALGPLSVRSLGRAHMQDGNEDEGGRGSSADRRTTARPISPSEFLRSSKEILQATRLRRRRRPRRERERERDGNKALSAN